MVDDNAAGVHPPPKGRLDYVRPGAQYKSAGPEDLEGLAALCLDARAESTVGAQLCSPDADVLREQLGAFVATPGGRLLVGLLDERIAGFMLARVVGPSPFTQDVSLHVEALYVAEADRRRGLGHTLLAGALEVAEETGATQLFAVPLPGARGVQRFFARLGFAPAAAHRVVAVPTLQRRLAGDPVRASARRRGTHGLEDLIARRRQVRKETQTGPVDLRDVKTSLERAEGSDQSAERPSMSKHVRRAVANRRDSESSTTIS